VKKNTLVAGRIVDPRQRRLDGPELPPEPDLEFCQCGDVGPGHALDDRADGRAIDARDRCDFAHAAVPDSSEQIEDEQAGHLRDAVIDRRMRPIDTQLVWGDTGWARAHAESLLPLIGRFTEEIAMGNPSLVGCSYSQHPEEVTTAMNGYVPRGAPYGFDEVEPFIRDAITLAAPQTAYTAQRLMTVATPFVLWCVGDMGLPLDAEVIFSRHVIDIYTNDETTGRSEGTRRNYRAILMRISEVLIPESHPAPMTALNARTSQPPYTEKEMIYFRRWATGQTTLIRRQKAMVMLALTAGAGMKSAEIGTLLREDVHVDDRGIVVCVRGAFPREIPLLQEWEAWLATVLGTVPAGGPVFGTVGRINSKNMLSSFTSSTTGLAPRSDRLRATWVVHHLTVGTPMKEFLRACGVRKLENLSRYLDYIEPASEETYRLRVRGEIES
jgi:integrase